MAPPRPYWKGYLKLSLVSCPIALYTATSPGERVAFRQINKKTGNRLRQQLVDEETGEPIAPDDKGRGYEVDKGVYLRVEDEELDAIAIESSHTIDIDSFVPKSEIDERYIDSPYYLIPENKVALEAFAVIRDAMRDKNMVALGRVVLSKREPRSVTLMRFETRRSISATSARLRSRRTCWLWPSIFSIARRRHSTPRNSTTAMKRRS
jgi:DNA end-binding protein Ku